MTSAMVGSKEEVVNIFVAVIPHPKVTDKLCMIMELLLV